MEKHALEIHSENILPIIKKWLYSERDIFIRELVSNSCDAIQKVKILRDRGMLDITDEEFRIDIKIDATAKTLTFMDNGIGMTNEEVRKYIAQIAFSGAEEFMSKYQSNVEGEQIIGHFGLGFYSAYMVADKVEINTKSYLPDAEPVYWICDGSSSYEIDVGTRETRGTTVTLYIGSEHEDCLEESHIKKALQHFCSFLPYPIYLNDKRINEQEPLWIKPISECTKENYIDFFNYLYPFEDEPLFWVHLNVDYPFHLQGILYFPKVKKDYDLSKSHVKLYCNRVFVSDNCKDIIPNYLTMLKGVIDSPDIPLNVSRSYLQMDRTVRQLGNHISKKVTDSLNTLYKTEYERFVSIWNDLSVVVKLGIMEDEKFYERAKDFLIWKTTNNTWTTLAAYLERNGSKNNNKIFYTVDEKHSSHILDIYHQKGIEVICANSFLDTYVIDFLERKLSPTTFQRIDAELHDEIIDKTREKSLLDSEGKTAASHLAEFISNKLGNDQITVEAKSLVSDQVSGMILINEQERRFRDHMQRMNQEGGSSPFPFGKKTFIVNTNNSLIASIQALDHKYPELAKELTQEVYELALLSQREMDPHALNEFIQRTNHVLTSLTKQLNESS